MKRLALILTLALGGCFAKSWDPHAPKTVVASEEGGAVTVNHGARLRIPLGSEDPKYEWRRVEPQIMRVVAEGPPDERGQTFTPVRSGEEKLKLEYRPLGGAGEAKRVVTYDITVPEYGVWGKVKDWFRRSQGYY
ncbi:MAG TPA: hypothetical protein VEQ87_19980 [Burkholderiales bacterium]|nr:hypothetical protein [Burkholderiales bacterium]